MVKSVFAKITDAKRFLCFLMIKNTPAEMNSPWDNHKSLRSTTSITTEVPELQDEARPKSLAPPPTAQTAGPNWLKF